MVLCVQCGILLIPHPLVFVIQNATSNVDQDAAHMLETATNRHTGQLKEIFAQAGKLYGSEIDRQGQRNSKRLTYML